MAEYPALPIWTDAFIADTIHLSAEETGAYLMLLMCAWRTTDCSLPDDDKKLQRMSRVNARNWPRVRDVVMGFWRLDGGKWTQKKLSKVRLRVHEIADTRRKSGSRGGKAKALKNNKPSLANAKATPKQKASIQNQNQREKDVSNETSKKTGPTKCPPDWQAKSDTLERLMSEGYTLALIERCRLEMIDWSRSNDKRKHDWDATLRNWVRKAGNRSNDKPDRTTEAADRIRDDLRRGQASRSEGHAPGTAH